MPCCESLRQQHPNHSKQHGAKVKGQHAGGAEDLESATVFPGILAFCWTLIFGAVNTFAFGIQAVVLVSVSGLG